jgi:hypothetical protein
MRRKESLAGRGAEVGSATPSHRAAVAAVEDGHPLSVGHLHAAVAVFNSRGRDLILVPRKEAC